MVYLGELALSGEIRAVPFLDARLKEIERLGYKNAAVPAGSKCDEAGCRPLALMGVKNLDYFIEMVMGG